ncbi:hypothetical protein [Candidatus Endomicrobiellum trichonymphae]|uniref:hypothetical protein n=1 Tax=Endomicrobium trichonymphae TaxID=1408204 RepID=UPI0013053CDD|nr:hypothetical protein [Candidatus Endomicrobium trichonymphae]
MPQIKIFSRKGLPFKISTHLSSTIQLNLASGYLFFIAERTGRENIISPILLG